MREITSYSNSTIKFIRGLQSRKNRKLSGKFYIEGVLQVGEAFKHNFPLESIIFSPELLIADYGKSVIEKAAQTNIDVIKVSADLFISISNKKGPHGIAAVGKQRYFNLDNNSLEGLWIALENPQDPGNLGSILRSLDGAGGKGLILIGEATDPYHPTAVRASTGAVFYIPIVQISQNEFIDFVQDNNIYCFGTYIDASTSYKNIEYPRDMILVMGSEQKGLSDQLAGACDTLIYIPMGGSVDSLNLANAASIVLFEIYTREINKK